MQNMIIYQNNLISKERKTNLQQLLKTKELSGNTMYSWAHLQYKQHLGDRGGNTGPRSRQGVLQLYAQDYGVPEFKQGQLSDRGLLTLQDTREVETTISIGEKKRIHWKRFWQKIKKKENLNKQILSEFVHLDWVKDGLQHGENITEEEVPGLCQRVE